MESGSGSIGFGRRREREGLLVEWFYTDLGRAVLTVLHAHAPGLATDLAVLDVLLRRSAAGIDRDLDRFIAVRTIHRRRRLGRPIAERKFGIGQFFVVVQRHRQNWLTVREG